MRSPCFSSPEKKESTDEHAHDDDGPRSPLDCPPDEPLPSSEEIADSEHAESQRDAPEDVEDWLQMSEQVQREETQRKGKAWEFNFHREHPESNQNVVEWEVLPPTPSPPLCHRRRGY